MSRWLQTRESTSSKQDPSKMTHIDGKPMQALQKAAQYKPWIPGTRAHTVHISLPRPLYWYCAHDVSHLILQNKTYPQVDTKALRLSSSIKIITTNDNNDYFGHRLGLKWGMKVRLGVVASYESSWDKQRHLTQSLLINRASLWSHTGGNLLFLTWNASTKKVLCNIQLESNQIGKCSIDWVFPDKAAGCTHVGSVEMHCHNLSCMTSKQLQVCVYSIVWNRHCKRVLYSIF